jgi:hypothetical protein
MAVCTICQQEMVDEVSCSADPLDIGGELYEPIRWGREAGYRRDLPPVRCHDCGVWPGGVHHHGCDCEECPACHGQAISCDCDRLEDGWDPDEPIDWIYLRFPSRSTGPR